MINLELYSDKKTFIHRIHPSIKIISILLLFGLLLIFNDPYYVFAELMLILLPLIISRSLQNIMRIKWLILMISVMSFALWSLFIKEGKMIFTLGPVTVTDTGLKYGITSAFRITGMLVAGMLLVYTTRIEELAAGCRALGVPYRLAFSLTTAIRLLPTFLGAGSVIIQAQESRGHDIRGGSFLRRMKNYVPLLVPSFLYGMRNVSHLTMALEARGFSRSGPRTSFLEFKIKLSDILSLLLLSVIFIFSIYLRLKGNGIIIGRI